MSRYKRARAGRKRKEGVARTPSGRISESQANQQSMQESEQRLALEVATWRRRQDNPSLTITEACLPEHGSVVEKLHETYKLAVKRGKGDEARLYGLTTDQYDAAQKLERIYRSYMASIGGKTPRSSSDFSGPAGHSGVDPFSENVAKRDALVEQAYKKARRAILEDQHSNGILHPLGMMAVETMIYENKEVLNLLPDLKLALNRLTRLWGLSVAD